MGVKLNWLQGAREAARHAQQTAQANVTFVNARLALHLSAKIRPTRKAIQVLSLAAPYT
jgi:hypothetical protein